MPAHEQQQPLGLDGGPAVQLEDVCRQQLRAHFGLSIELEPPSQLRHGAADYLARSLRLAETLRDAGYDHATAETLYAVVPALLAEYAEVQDASAGDADADIDAYLAGWERSDLPFYPIVLAIKTLERRLFALVETREPTLDLGIGDGYTSDFVFHPRTLTLGGDPLLDETLAARAHRRHRRLACMDATALPAQ